ncbi:MULTISPECIES: ester cyclase [unclassified Mesorhizobium]|uniref:ester cyclase n=1 Tax=unclassified Mesorhizobium TaxID=325217 RepID=UPI00333A9146
MKATGNRVDFAAFQFYRIADGKLAEHWEVADFAKFQEQLTAKPPGSAFNAFHALAVILNFHRLRRTSSATPMPAFPYAVTSHGLREGACGAAKTGTATEPDYGAGFWARTASLKLRRTGLS